jgi:hypothetical protein
MRLQPDSFAQSTVVTAQSTANAPVSITITPAADEHVVIDQIVFSYSTVNVAGGITVAFGGVVKLRGSIVVGGLGHLMFRTGCDDGLYNGPAPAKGEAVVVTLLAGGAAVIGDLNVIYR